MKEYKGFGLEVPNMPPEEAEQFGKWVLSFQRRPWDWVCACYPWGSGPLRDRSPEAWQRRELMQLQEELEGLSDEGWKNHVVRFSTSAGNGVGKTSLVAWLIHWFVSVFPCGQGQITASTEGQLQGKTWRELRKWQMWAINGWQMEWTATRYRHKEMPEQWYVEARSWSESNPQAFAGMHERYVLTLFDEASGIAPVIWDVIEGAMTTGLVLFFAFGNPSETAGGFWDTHNRYAHLWTRFRVDAREVSFANKEEIARWEETYGVGSDFCKVHIYGEFPLATATSFMDGDMVQHAIARNIEWRYIPRSVPRLLGVDLARGGGDLNVCVLRQGRKVDPNIKAWAERDALVSADIVARFANEMGADLIMVDGVGLGGPVIDYLRRRGFGRKVVDCQGGAAPNDPEDAKRYANMRTTMWARMREWMRYADLPNDRELSEELVSPRFRNQLKTDKTLLEPKQEMRKRGVKSPNKGDALGNTFWYAVPPIGASLRSGIVEADEV